MTDEKEELSIHDEAKASEVKGTEIDDGPAAKGSEINDEKYFLKETNWSEAPSNLTHADIQRLRNAEEATAKADADPAVLKEKFHPDVLRNIEHDNYLLPSSGIDNTPKSPGAEIDDVSPTEHEGADHVELPNGLRNVAVNELPEPEGINGPADFKKISPAQMEASINRLQEMRPVVESGEGADSDYWYNVDQQRGFGPADGYAVTYHAFYGNDAITLDKTGDQYNIIDGRHRIWMAKQMDVPDLPARVLGRNSESDTR